VPFDGKSLGWAVGSGTVIEMLINDLYFYFYISVSFCPSGTNANLTGTSDQDFEDIV
jgi:hypothetical protein